MASLRPFLFNDRDFDQQAAAAAMPPKQRPQFSQEEMDVACAAATQRGFEDGLANATQSEEAKIVRLLQAISGQAQILVSADATRQVEAQQMAIDVAAVLIQKLLPDLVNEPMLESMGRLIRQVMVERFDEPRLIIRVYDSVLDVISTRLEGYAQQSGFRGQYALMADHNLAPSDCRVEWSSGGVERSAVRLWETVQVSLEQIKASLTTPLTSNESDS